MSNKIILFNFLCILFLSKTNAVLSMDQSLTTIYTIASYRILSNQNDHSVCLGYETSKSIGEYCVEKKDILKIFEELENNKKNNTINLSQKYCPYNKDPLYLIETKNIDQKQKTFYLPESLIEKIKQNLNNETNSTPLELSFSKSIKKPIPMITNCQTDWKMDRYKPHVTILNVILNEKGKTEKYYEFNVNTTINEQDTNFTIQLSHQDVKNLSDTLVFGPENNQAITVRDSQNCPCVLIPMKINFATTDKSFSIQKTGEPTIEKKDKNEKYPTKKTLIFLGIAFLAIAAFVTVIKLLK